MNAKKRLKTFVNKFNYFIIILFPPLLLADGFGGQPHFHYDLKMPPISILHKIESIAAGLGWKHSKIEKWNLTPIADENFHKWTKERIDVSVFPNEDTLKIGTRIYFEIIHDSIKIDHFKVFKSVSLRERFWAWSLHNPFGLFDFPLRLKSEPKNTPFTKEQKEAIEKIMNRLISD